ncbi:hypothetical protein SeLEV6574_g07339, partial [Synchytrium endobioticum]
MFKLPKSQVELVDKYIDEELAEGKIIPSASPVAANLFFVPKADSTTELRPCVDYRDLNSCTVDDRYPMPAVSDLIQKLCGGDYYAKVDLRKAYNSIRVEEGKEWKLALVNLLDDFAIKTCGTLQDHIRNIESFLQRMGEIEVFLKDSKCQWFAKEIPFLGFMVNRYGYWKQPEKLEAIREYGTPKSQKDVRIFT